MGYEKALKDFLVYSYFGIIPKNLYKESKYKNAHTDDTYNDYCTKMVIIKAYDDATNEGAYNTLFKNQIPEIKKLKERSKEAKKKSAELLFESLKKYEKINNFDDWHNELCKEIVNKYSEVKVDEPNFFTYGNAQKWVNMTLKYLWLLELLPKGIKEEDLHIPVDSYIIDALWKEKDITLPLKSDKNRSIDYKQPSEYVKPWSQWNHEDYEPFNESIQSIQGTDYTLSWENKEWIKMSELRKHTKQEKKYTGFFGE